MQKEKKGKYFQSHATHPSGNREVSRCVSDGKTAPARFLSAKSISVGHLCPSRPYRERERDREMLRDGAGL